MLKNHYIYVLDYLNMYIVLFNMCSVSYTNVALLWGQCHELTDRFSCFNFKTKRRHGNHLISSNILTMKRQTSIHTIFFSIYYLIKGKYMYHKKDRNQEQAALLFSYSFVVKVEIKGTKELQITRYKLQSITRSSLQQEFRNINQIYIHLAL